MALLGRLRNYTIRGVRMPLKYTRLVLESKSGLRLQFASRARYPRRAGLVGREVVIKCTLYIICLVPLNTFLEFGVWPMVPTSYYIILSAILFTLGVAGVLVRRNAIIIFMSVELMLNSANL